MRAFLALDFPDATKEIYAVALGRFEQKFPALRWVRPELLHLTLVFLGDIAGKTGDALRPPVAAALAGFEPGRCSFGSPGSFGPRKAPRTFWFALDAGREELERLQPRLVAACRAAGLTLDDRKGGSWTPHVTVARSRRSRSGDGPAAPVTAEAWSLEAGDSPLPGTQFEVSGITLMSSRLSPRGPTYTPVWIERAKS